VTLCGTVAVDLLLVARSWARSTEAHRKAKSVVAM
jgi:hypothetical protein